MLVCKLYLFAVSFTVLCVFLELNEEMYTYVSLFTIACTVHNPL